MRDLKDRYQNQRWYVRLWRCRFLIPVPYRALKYLRKNRKSPDYDDQGFRKMRYQDYVSIETGMANISMKWYYTTDEVRYSMKKRKKRSRFRLVRIIKSIFS